MSKLGATRDAVRGAADRVSDGAEALAGAATAHTALVADLRNLLGMLAGLLGFGLLLLLAGGSRHCTHCEHPQ